jgi:hypothetical protein
MIDGAVNSFINSPASVLSLFALIIFFFAKGWVLPLNWVNKLLKTKDETIETQAKQIEDLTKAAPLVVKIMEELNRQAEQKKIERQDSGDYHA